MFINYVHRLKYIKMAKFLKSLFHPSEKRKCDQYEGECGEDKSEASPTMCDRRKLSISRSGRLRQANKKRHSLTLELYGDNIETVEKPKSMEYHVHSPVTPTEQVLDKRQRRRSVDDKTSQDFVTSSSDSAYVNTTGARNVDDNRKRTSAGSISPEDEIDSAFEIIDKS